MGVKATDEFLMKVSDLTGKEIPEALRLERGRLIDAMADSQAYLHGKTYAIFGDPDFVYAMARFVMEMGGEPKHCPRHQRRQGLGSADEGAAGLPRPSAKAARSGRARTSGTCARSSPRNRRTC